MTTPMLAEKRHWLRRIGWLALIWTASVAALAVAARLFRILMTLAGLTV
jgi:hypothetical protein